MYKRIPLFLVVLLALALVGFVVTFWASPINMLLSIGLLALLFYFLNNFMKTGRFLPVSKGSGRKNVKQASKHGRTPIKKNSRTARRDIPFQVIEGSKGKSQPRDDEKDSNISH